MQNTHPHPSPTTPAALPEPVELPPDVAIAMGHLRVVLKVVQQSLAQVQEDTGVSGSQLWCLAAVAREPGIRVTQLAHTLGVRQATVSKLVELLVQRRLLMRQRGEQDQRVVKLRLSEEGEQALRRAPVPAAGVLPQALLRLPAGHLGQLNGLLAELREALGPDAPAASRTPLAELLQDGPGRR